MCKLPIDKRGSLWYNGGGDAGPRWEVRIRIPDRYPHMEFFICIQRHCICAPFSHKYPTPSYSSISCYFFPRRGPIGPHMRVPIVENFKKICYNIKKRLFSDRIVQETTEKISFPQLRDRLENLKNFCYNIYIK